MKIQLLVVIAFVMFSASAFSANGDIYGNCDSPLDSYACFDIKETPQCPGNLEHAKGWCSGGNNIQCCAPPGTPEGDRVGGPGIQPVKEISPSNLMEQDFKLFLEGNLLCGYEVKSNGQTTKQSAYSCDSYVTVTVGPVGDCRDEGTDTCEIVNDGGYFGYAKTYKFSVKFEKPIQTFGQCSGLYSEFSCAKTDDCRQISGNSVKGYCPGLPNDIRCCILSQSAAENSKYVHDKSRENTLSTGYVEEKLVSIYEKYGARIVLEIVDEIPNYPEKNLRDKFHLLYGMGQEERTEALLIYAKGKNAWRGISFKNSPIDAKMIKDIKSDGTVAQNFRDKNYDAAFAGFADLLVDEIGNRLDDAVAGGSCQRQCDSLLGCSREKCVNIDGCLWNSGRCENICNEGDEKEIVVVKKNEGCENADTCPDLYMCVNGQVSEGYPIKAASGANLGNKIRRGDKKTPDGTFDIIEKVQVVENGADFIYLDDNGNEVQPLCNLDPATTGIRDYWMQLSYPDKANAANPDDPRGSCIGIHGSSSDKTHTLGCVKVVEKEKLDVIFSSADLGTDVTIKDPYNVEKAASSFPITGNAAGDADEFAASCSAICSWYGSSLANMVGLTNCEKRCSQLGCYWENDKCSATASICKITPRNKIQQVVVVSSMTGVYFDDTNKVVAREDDVDLIALIKLSDGGWYTGPSEKFTSNSDLDGMNFYVTGKEIKPKMLGYPATVKWFTVDPEIGHLSYNSVDLLKSNCFEADKGSECEVCPDVDQYDQNYCWYQNIRRSPFWIGSGDGIVYHQNELGNSWSENADSGVGTKRYRAEITLNGVVVSSPGAADNNAPSKLKSQFYSQGITNDVHRISRLSDFDTTCPDPFKGSEGCEFMSYIDSYVNVPWVWGASVRQRDSYVGFDCAELAVGAHSQMTRNKYGDLTAHVLATGSATKSVIGGRLWFDKNGNTVDKNGNTVTVNVGLGENELGIGDLILLDYDSNNLYDHTTIFLGDENGNGVLDADDKIETSCHWIKETVLQQSESTLSKFLSFCGLKKREIGNEKQLNLGSICSMDVKDELSQKNNIAWIIRRFV
ncbi:MAG TPA: L,D-transpeptidase family protein [archaeon]|nr:L,D-transpeptidase family protein [archaeon]